MWVIVSAPIFLLDILQHDVGEGFHSLRRLGRGSEGGKVVTTGHTMPRALSR